MRKFVLFFVALIFVSGISNAQTVPMANGFRLPLDGSPTQSCNFGTLDCFYPGQYHLAEDYDVSPTTMVRACAKGIVKEARSSSGYGGIVVIEHLLPSGEYVVSICAHMLAETLQVSVGQEVTAGQIIGYIADRWENGGNYSPHLHFGIHKGSYDGTPVYGCDGEWRYQGYSENICVLDDWYDPSDFIEDNPVVPSVVGHFSDGWHDDGTSQAFVDKYQQLLSEGHNLGAPWDNGPGDEYVHEVNGMLIQDFRDRRDEGGASNGFYHPYTALIMGPQGVKLLKEGFWDYWMNHHGWFQIGAPITDEEGNPSNGYVYQDFEMSDSQNIYHSYLLWDGNSITLNDVGSSQSYLQSWVTIVNNSNKAVMGRTSMVNGVYQSEIPVADFGEPFQLINNRSYNTLYASVDGQDILIDEFTVTGDMTIVVGGEDAPVADFSATPTFGVAPLTVQFNDLSTNNPNDWWWNFGDGNTSTSQVPSHTYSMPGTYTVSFTASNSGGSDTEVKTSYVTVTDGLVVDFVADVTSGLPPLTVQFSNQSSGNFTSWYWYFGDGNTSDEENPIHTYYVPGSRTVTLVASNINESKTEVKTGYITVTDPNPVDFTASRTNIGSCDGIRFTSQVDMAVDSWHWDFGDGESSTYQNPGHTYDMQGIYDVTLTITNQDGSFSKTKQSYITVGECLVDMSADVTEGELPLEVHFQGSSPGSPTGWAWDFGDGEFAFVQNPSHVYTEPGTYEVQMAVIYDGYDSALIIREAYITVTGVSGPGNPMAFKANVTEGSAPLQVSFTNLSTIEAVLWFWDFGDGGNAMSKHASHVYMSPGAYSVTLYAFTPGMQTLVYENYINVFIAKQVLVTETQLKGNYPNPFNPSTTINFSLDKAQAVEIAIYDVAGRRVAQLVNQALNPGNHSVEWLGRDSSGKSVSTGMYFVRMRSEKGVEVKKITLLK